ncbi:ATP synthase subunit C [Mycoplasmoides gallisepticum]|uniref:ATP synthase subunit c n=4 Tax=Mycoplasmoides gallisepticum TaxID=2096 RepID=ATPL_MYCGA|nr:ATP synthase subunit C [Mycoplasmoides gallisepticum]P33258.2 RecName: Full=ATP synthase subunit c; AltName: Full=ATP synthase F(0) sector subunit c; AltName: Full=F-type ATPase subunit c; Short=F-ATPase subunit c; AltName: Full=Lipid-binding protein [Mycoplasmoides gallisepticum str. R(low)]AAP56651.1 ATP synthase C chain [Mycoplasmoides gallisepticum str. R(low)]ADC30498.1 ATP synthase C chain [Mycoplasmoides gallisepticum str. R(high)]ADC31464.1 ATP synthase C chain [Mycoplasmoides gallis
MNIFLVIHELINQADQVNVTLTNHVGAYIGAGMAMTAAAGVGVGQGFASGLCATALARNPELLPKIQLFWIVGSAIAESSAIYGLIIAFILIFVAR